MPDTAEEALAGVPECPLYKRLASSLLKSIASGCFCGGFEKVSLGKEVIGLREKEDEWRKLIIQKGSELVNVSLIVHFSLLRTLVNVDWLFRVFVFVLLLDCSLCNYSNRP